MIAKSDSKQWKDDSKKIFLACDNGRSMMSAEKSQAEASKLRQLKDSKLYRATQLVVMNRLEKKMRALYESRNELERDDNKPAIFSILAATQTKRKQLEIELKDELDRVNLQKCVSIDDKSEDE